MKNAFRFHGIAAVLLVTTCCVPSNAAPKDHLANVPRVAAPSEEHPCKIGEVADCLARCGKGGMESCYRAARSYSSGTGVAKDSPKSRELFRAGCEGGGGNACNGWAVSFREGAGVPQDHAVAAAIFERACTLGSTKGCVNAGALWHFAGNLGRNIPKARELYEKGCAGDDGPAGDSCLNLGQIARSMEDTKAAKDWFNRGCSLGNPRACAESQTLGGPGLNPAETFLRYQKGCSRGEGTDCVALAFAYRQGKGTTVDEPQALKHFERACDLGYPEGCSHVGHSARKDDPSRAAAFYKRGCAQRPNTSVIYAHEDSCLMFLEQQYAGRGTARDADGALAALDTMCQAQHVGAGARSLAACISLTKKWQEDRHDSARATAYRRIACELGHKQSCRAQ